MHVSLLYTVQIFLETWTPTYANYNFRYIFEIPITMKIY